MALVDKNRRHWIVALFLQIGIRLKYWIENLFGIVPLFSPLTAYPSPWRPKECPKFDFLTQTIFIWIYFIAGITREYSIFYYFMCKTGLIHILNGVHSWNINRLISKFKAAGYTSAKREVPIPEYDWKNGDPEEFYNTFVARPHPVVLRGFMKNTDLLKELKWENVLKKYGDEDVFLTKKELDGFPGKLRDVDNPNVYLHNSEILFAKYPEIRLSFKLTFFLIKKNSH